jgi:hypothetical protein
MSHFERFTLKEKEPEEDQKLSNKYRNFQK